MVVGEEGPLPCEVGLGASGPAGWRCRWRVRWLSPGGAGRLRLSLVGGWVPCPVAGWAGEGPTVVCLVLVVGVAEAGELVEGRAAGVGPPGGAGGVVDLEAVADVAAGDGAAGVSQLERGALGGGGAAAEVGDGTSASNSGLVLSS